MASFLLKCIPCARAGKIEINKRSAKAKQDPEKCCFDEYMPQERAVAQMHQQTPVVPRARPYELIQMGEIEMDNGVKTTVKSQ